MKRRAVQCVVAGLIACACSKDAADGAGVESSVDHARELDGLVLYKSSPAEGLIGELKSSEGRITFEVRRGDGSDPVAARDPDSRRSAQARIRDSRGVILWGVGTGLERPSTDEETRKSAATAPPSTADLDLVKKLPSVLRESGIDAQALSLELKALEGASAAFRGVDGPGGPVPRPPSISNSAEAE